MTPPLLTAHAALSARARTHWLLKSVGITAFISAFFYLYFLLLNAPQFPVTTMPALAIDAWIGFHPSALVFYVSLWFYVPLPAILMRTKAELFAYGWQAGAVAAVGLGIFLFWPTAVPPAGIDWARYPGFEFLKNVDASGNACPSLHVAFSVFSAIWIDRILRATASGALLRGINSLWCIGIVYSTLATKQHVAIDAVAGIALGVAGSLFRLPALASLGKTTRPPSTDASAEHSDTSHTASSLPTTPPAKKAATNETSS